MPKRKKKVSFYATVKVPERKKVSFRTSSGRKVSFHATVKVPKKKKVSFYARKKKGKK